LNYSHSSLIRKVRISANTSLTFTTHVSRYNDLSGHEGRIYWFFAVDNGVTKVQDGPMHVHHQISEDFGDHIYLNKDSVYLGIDPYITISYVNSHGNSKVVLYLNGYADPIRDISGSASGEIRVDMSESNRGAGRYEVLMTLQDAYTSIDVVDGIYFDVYDEDSTPIEGSDVDDYTIVLAFVVLGLGGVSVGGLLGRGSFGFSLCCWSCC